MAHSTVVYRSKVNNHTMYIKASINFQLIGIIQLPTIGLPLVYHCCINHHKRGAKWGFAIGLWCVVLLLSDTRRSEKNTGKTVYWTPDHIQVYRVWLDWNYKWLHPGAKMPLRNKYLLYFINIAFVLNVLYINKWKMYHFLLTQINCDYFKNKCWLWNSNFYNCFIVALIKVRAKHYTRQYRPNRSNNCDNNRLF